MRPLIGIALVITLCLGCGIRKDELDCEKAVAHLVACCPGVQPSQFDCGDLDSDPRLPLAESDCITGKSCSAIKAAGLCALGPDGSTDGGVCQ